MLSQDDEVPTFAALTNMLSQDDPAPTFSALIAGPPGQDRRETRRRPDQRAEPRSIIEDNSLRPLSLMEDNRLQAKTSLAQPRIDGVAYGLDYVGNFNHHTGALGPFGFYANFFEEK